MFKFLKKIKIQFCCGSKCVINDTNNDGVPDTVKIEYQLDEEKIKEQRNKYFNDEFN